MRFSDQERRLIIGDSGTGVFNLSGGTVNLNNSLVVANNSDFERNVLLKRAAR